MNFSSRILILSSLSVSCAAANAAVVYNSFGPANGFEPVHSYGSGAFENNFYTNACQFTSSTSGTLNRITIPLTSWGGQNSASVRLYADSSNSVGAQLGSWLITNLPPFTGNPYTPSQITFGGGPSLVSG